MHEAYLSTSDGWVYDQGTVSDVFKVALSKLASEIRQEWEFGPKN